MNHFNFDLIAFGSAIVDSLMEVDDAYLKSHDMTKGSMALIDQPDAELFNATLTPHLQTSGGSSANTAAIAGLLGASSKFIGKVNNDVLGKIFADEMIKTGAKYDVAPIVDGVPTGACYVFVTPDGERTMNTYLGACHLLDETDFTYNDIEHAKIIYLEGYMFDLQAVDHILGKIKSSMNSNPSILSISLSDIFLIQRARSKIEQLMQDNPDLWIFGNNDEFCELLDIDEVNETTLNHKNLTQNLIVTKGEQGAVAYIDGIYHDANAFPSTSKDTTGAGDSFAAGFLTGLAKGMDITSCLSLGCFIASHVIRDFGARPRSDFLELARQQGFDL